MENEQDGPTRPDGYYGSGYKQGTGGYVSETTAAAKNEAMINREAHKQSAQQRLNQHIAETAKETPDKGAAREALMQHLEGAKREITSSGIDAHPPDPRDRQGQHEHER